MSARDFDPRLILWVLRLRWRLLVVCAMLTPAVAVVLGDHLPATYKARARVLVQDSKAVNPFLVDILVDWSAKRRGAVITSILKSPITLRRVLEALGTIDRFTPPEAVDAAVRTFARRVSVFGIGGGVFQLSLSGSDADAVHRGLELLVDAFIEEMLRPQKEAVTRSAGFLGAQLGRLEADLQTREDALAEFKRTHAAELPDVYRMNLDAQLTLRESLLTAEVGLQASRRRLAQARTELQTLDPVARDLEKRLVAARARQAELDAAYRPNHPAVQAQMAKVRALGRQLATHRRAKQPARIDTLRALASQRADGAPDLLASELLAFDAVRGDVASHEAQVRLLQKRLSESTRHLEAFAEHERTLTRMQRSLAIKRKLYEQLALRHEEALVTHELAVVDEENQVWVIEPPVRPQVSSRPSRALRAIGGAIGGLVLGVALAGVAELCTGVVRRRDELEAMLGVPVIADVPPLTRG